MSRQDISSRITLALVLTAATIVSGFPLQQLTAGPLATNDLPIFEDFEDPNLDPGLTLAGDPKPSVTGEISHTGDFSLEFPCQLSDDPVILVQPAPVPGIGIQSSVSMSVDCFSHASFFTLIELSLEGGGTSTPVASVRLKRDDGSFRISTSIRADNGATTTSSWLPLDAASALGEPMWLELDWTASQGVGSDTGSLQLVVRRRDGSPMLAIDQSGVDNDSHLVGRAEIGVQDAQGLTSAPRSILLDDLVITP